MALGAANIGTGARFAGELIGVGAFRGPATVEMARIRKLKEVALKEGAELWPNHDIDFFQNLPGFPAWRD